MLLPLEVGESSMGAPNAKKASVTARVAALPGMTTADLKAMWRELFDAEPPIQNNRQYLVNRLAYRLQELAFGGIKPAVRAKLDAMADALDPKAPKQRNDLPHRRHGSDTRVERYRAASDGGRERLRLAGPAVQVAVGGRQGDHRHPMEWPGLLRPSERQIVKPDPKIKPRRCAVYTRKSSEEGLEQEFNSLDAQREACEAFIASQKHEGWIGLPDRYDDGGISGGTLERPALQRLIREIEAGMIDVVVVYKIDRLSRALTDFAKLVDVFERHDVTFVAVTQQFNTTTSMGRLTLNILLSFAQFEREVIGERIRDKFAASRKKGMWMGGVVPLGYKIRDRKLVIVKKEADLVRRIFDRFAKTGLGAHRCARAECRQRDDQAQQALDQGRDLQDAEQRALHRPGQPQR